MEKDKKDYSIRFEIGNLVCFVIIYLISIILVWKIVKIILIRVLMLPILFYICGQVEIRFMVRIINPIIVLTLPKDIRKKERFLWKEIRKEEKEKKSKKSNNLNL